ncbi:hypothetical protein AWENTII_009396 [Aspergillus wentii]
MTYSRKNIRDLKPNEEHDLVKAFYKIQQLDPNDPDSFFTIAGYHGEPFRGAGYEQALQKQVPGVALHYWNEIDGKGIPEIFLQKKYVVDGKEIDNPLRSYRYQKTIQDRLSPFPDADYSKPKGRETCRFPFSGLYGNADCHTSDAHNNIMNLLGQEKTDQLLQTNVKQWLEGKYTTSGGDQMTGFIKAKYLKSLKAPNYTVFSNTTSAARWNDDNPPDVKETLPGVVPLESPHNGIHLAIGGIQIPVQDASSVPGANGDMAENDTAAFDPIFFFHHAFVDLIFWRWQIEHNQTKALIDDKLLDYPGTNSVDAQGPTPGVTGGSWLTLTSPLAPFKRGSSSDFFTSQDVANIEKLGYTYDIPPQIPLPKDGFASPIPTPARSPYLRIGGINRAAVRGSFVISAWSLGPEGRKLVGAEPVLSRWHVLGCANCQNHLDVLTHMPLDGWKNSDAENTNFEVRVHTRDHPSGHLQLAGRTPSLKVIPKATFDIVAPEPRLNV